MRPPLHLGASTAFLVLTSGLAAAGAAPLDPQMHSPQVTLRHTTKPEDLSWLWAFADPAPDGRENALASDPRFQALLRQSFTAPQSFWGANDPLHSVANDFLHGPPGRVLADDNRYLTADACVPHFCHDRGLFWADLGAHEPLLVFAAIDWISDNRTTGDAASAYSMWVFPNRPLDRAHLPPALVRSVARWTAQPSSGSTALQNITRVFLVDPDGTPHTLAPATIGAHTDLPPETTNDSEVQP